MNKKSENKTRKLTEKELEVAERLLKCAFASIEAMYKYELKTRRKKA